MPNEGDRCNGFDGLGNFRRLVAALGELPLRPAFVVVSGDLSNDGSPASYRRLKRAIDESPLAGLPWLVGLGNHDGRAGFREGFLGEAAGRTDAYDHVATIDGLRVVTLDSHIPGAIDGDVDDGQIARLRATLARPAECGTIVVVHHHVVRCPVIRLNEIALRRASLLGEVVAGRDVLGILGGHIHFFHAGALAGIPCVTAPGIMAQVDPTTPAPVRSVAGIGFNVVQVDRGGMTATPVMLPL
jgi:3',5'-cyclic AMP phosphodiesterase CpdA